MTADELAAIKSRADTATPGPWGAGHGVVGLPIIIQSADNADFIVYARDDIPALLAALDEATTLVQELQSQLAWWPQFKTWLYKSDYINPKSQIEERVATAHDLVAKRLPWEAEEVI